MKSYEVIRNALDRQSLDIIKNALVLMKDCDYHLKEKDTSDKSAFSDNFIKKHCWVQYGSFITESVLVSLQPLIERTVGLKLFPTYSYARLYWRHSHMIPHVDRPSCEYSVSICIDVDPEPWPIYMAGTELILQPGDLVVYKGMEVQHWRELYKGNQQAQIFLHYVNANGPHADCKFDYRNMLGLPGLP
jgi:hypothetical protein